MKNIIKKISKFIISRALYFALGICVAVAASVAYAAVTYPLPNVSTGDTLTASGWNDVVDDINDLDSRVNNFTCWVSGYTNCAWSSVYGCDFNQYVCPAGKFMVGMYPQSPWGCPRQYYCCDIALSCN